MAGVLLTRKTIQGMPAILSSRRMAGIPSFLRRGRTAGMLLFLRSRKKVSRSRSILLRILNQMKTDQAQETAAERHCPKMAKLHRKGKYLLLRLPLLLSEKRGQETKYLQKKWKTLDRRW